MQENNNVSLRELLEQLSTEDIDGMLMKELKRKPPDENAVRLILSILEEREKDLNEELIPQEETAWAEYRESVRTLLEPEPPRGHRWVSWFATAAVLAMVLIPLIPQRAEATRMWAFLDRWKAGVVEFFGLTEKVRDIDGTFVTDHEGMQQIYDEAVKLGIEEPIIPKHFESSYTVFNWKFTETRYSKGFAAELISSGVIAVFEVDIYDKETFHGYCRDEEYQYQFEKNGAEYKITHNIDRWVAIWNKENTEYFLTIDCSEDTFWSIIESTYKTEVIK